MPTARHEPPDNRHDREARAARRHLERLDEQGEKLIGGGRMADPETDPDDPMEIWGKRIGRGLAVLALIYLTYHLVTTYVLS